MRKSTLVALGIFVVAMVALVWLLGQYTDQVRFELETATEWTREMRDRGDLAPDTRVKLRRALAGPDRMGVDPSAFGLIVEVTPSDASVVRDPSGSGEALWLARSAFEAYPIERPISWVEVRVFHRGTSDPDRIAFTKGEDGLPVPVGPVRRVAIPVEAPRRAPSLGAPPAPAPPSNPAKPGVDPPAAPR